MGAPLLLLAAGAARFALSPSQEQPFFRFRHGLAQGASRLQLQIESMQLRLRRCLDVALPTKMSGPRVGEASAEGEDVESIYAFVADATSADPSWKMKLNKNGVHVWRRQIPGSRVDEVRASGIIDASPEAVMELLCDHEADVIRSYNPLYDEGYDVCTIDVRTRLSYASVRAFFPLKPRDTLTRVAKWELPRLGAGN